MYPGYMVLFPQTLSISKKEILRAFLCPVNKFNQQKKQLCQTH